MEEGEITLFNNIGKIVKKERFLNAGIDISEIPSGVYFVQIKSGHKVTMKKIIKE